MTNARQGTFIFAAITPKLKYYDQAKAALESIVPLTLAEPGCQFFAVFENCDSPGTLNLFERFTNEDAVREHYSREYTKHVFSAYEEWLERPVVVQRLFAASRRSEEQFV
jgi:quinol monooxygenase YgiN